MSNDYSAKSLHNRTLEHMKQLENSPSPSLIRSLWNGWVVVRAEFLDDTVTSLISTVKNLVRTIYDSLVAATAGVAFTDEGLRKRAVASGFDTGKDAFRVLKSLLGVIWPFIAKKVEDWIGQDSQKKPAAVSPTPAST